MLSTAVMFGQRDRMNNLVLLGQVDDSAHQVHNTWFAKLQMTGPPSLPIEVGTHVEGPRLSPGPIAIFPRPLTPETWGNPPHQQCNQICSDNRSEVPRIGALTHPALKLGRFFQSRRVDLSLQISSSMRSENEGSIRPPAPPHLSHLRYRILTNTQRNHLSPHATNETVAVLNETQNEDPRQSHLTIYRSIDRPRN